jgi:hypothetical protein
MRERIAYQESETTMAFTLRPSDTALELIPKHYSGFNGCERLENRSYIVRLSCGESLSFHLEADNIDHLWGVSIGSTARRGAIWFNASPRDRFDPAVRSDTTDRVAAHAIFRAWVTNVTGIDADALPAPAEVDA